ncbi:molybdopterin oxidoreductase family protein, partial [Gemmatimonadota bacterium]
GAGDAGSLPNNYPGFQPVTDPANRAKFELAYGREMDQEKGITKVTAFEVAGQGIRAMLIDGENTVLSDPDSEMVRKGLDALDHLVVIDIFPTETTELAHVVLPATAWGETEGTYTNTERRVQRVRAAVQPQGESKPDWWIIAQLAKRLGFRGFDWSGPDEVFDEYCELSPIYFGMDWERISSGQGLQWPVPEKGHPGTHRLHEESFPNGRGIFQLVTYRDPAEMISDEFPVWLTTGRRLESYHTRTQTGRAEGIDYLLPEEVLEVHPEDVEAWGLEAGGFAQMSSRRGSVRIKIQANDRSPRGTVFASFAFSDVPVNVLTGGGYDPVTHTAELKVCPVRLEPE